MATMEPVHVVVVVMESSFVVLGPFETEDQAERYAQVKRDRDRHTPLMTRYYVVTTVPPYDTNNLAGS